MRPLLALSPGLVETSFVLVEATPRPVGDARRHWNGLHFEWYQPMREWYRCIEVQTVQSIKTVAKLTSTLRTLRKRSIDGRGLDVAVVLDRAEIGVQKLQALWQACTDSIGAAPLVVDVDATERAERPAITMIDPKGWTVPARHNIVIARDIAGAVEFVWSENRAEVGPRAREASTLTQELQGFSWQPERRRARAFALALWYGERTGSEDAAVGIPKMDDNERKMLEMAMEEMREED